MSARIILLVFYFLYHIVPASAQARWFDSGKWVKLQFEQTGVYKITYEDLVSWDLNPQTISHENFHLLGIHGEILPSINPDSIFSQTEEIPMQINLGVDNGWGPGDYFLFFVKGTEGSKVDNNAITHYRNLYSNHSQMIFGFTQQPAKRIPKIESNEIPTQVISKTIWCSYHDSDMVNLNGMGRIWLGERLGSETLVRNFTQSIPSEIDTLQIEIATASAIEESNASLITTVNSVRDTITLSPLAIGTYDKYKYNIRRYTVTSNNGRLDIQLRLIRPNTKSSVYLDYFRISGKQPMTFSGKQVIYMDPAWQKIQDPIQLTINNTASGNFRLWNVSNPWQPEEYKTSVSGNEIQALVPANSNKSQFIAFNEMNLFIPKFLGGITGNSVFNSAEIPDLLIITHESLLPAAVRLADLRIKNGGLSVKVVTPQQIYNEFSGGQPDLIALRRCVRWLKAQSEKGKGNFKYVTLMGAASYDMLDRIANNTNRVPIYQSFGHSPAVIFCLDEYIVYTEAKQGDPEVSRSDKLGVAVGRIPARTLEEANGFVDKLERYASKQSLGPWRNNIVFSSDDADQVWETEFVYQSEDYAKFINKNNPSVKINKLYADAFKQVVNGNSERYPEFTSSLNKMISEGSLFINYQGHGGEKGLGQESLLDIPTIKSWRNEYKMPVLFTATCEFTKYDDPNFQSAGELAVLNPSGGAIASLTTTRLVFVPSNSAINRAFWTTYGFPAANDPIPTVGEVFQKLKNRPNKTDDDKKFALLGDASMKLAFPEHLIVVDSVQNKSAMGFEDTIKAFEIVNIKGHIQERGHGLMSDFSGNLWVTVYDKPKRQFTLDNDNNGSKLDFEEQNSVIYNGQVSVKDGLFTVVFVVPKDISYQVGEGKAIFYAHNNETDATGGWNFLLGSSAKVTEMDTTGPLVRAFLQDTSFVKGSSVTKDIDFVARVFDKNGINATGSGIGRDMVLIIDEGTEYEQNLVVNQYFQYDINSFTTGTLTVPLLNLEPGKHTFRCKVWDIYNNFGSDETHGVVTPGRMLTINEHGVYPNPISSNSKIWFSHSLPGEDLKLQWQISNSIGQLIGEGEWLLESSFARPAVSINELLMVNSFRSPQELTELQGGIYLYRMFISTADGLKSSFGGKMIIQP